MDVKEIIAPTVQDWETLEEFSDSLQDKAAVISECMAQLKKTPGDQEVAELVLRSLHNIKGDASLTKLALGVAIAHHSESLFQRFKAGEFLFSDVFSETILLSLDRLELAVDNLLHRATLENLQLMTLLQEMEKAIAAPPDKVIALCGKLIEAVTGFPPVSIAQVDESALLEPARPAESLRHDTQDVATDLQFFRSFAMQLESRSPFFKGRTNRILRLVLETNKAADSPVDPVQLEAAIYMHDVGMMMMPERTWLKMGHLSEEERLMLRGHPAYGAGLLQRMPGWEEAAIMVAQHHEMPNGSGYPLGIKDDGICEGAKLIAIVDAFEAVMLKHSHRGKNRSVLRAIAEVNACDYQFAPNWTLLFNQIIRRTVGVAA
ncbi:MAG: HD domain-containing protein [Zoogloeaceae bacterium]|jgi:HD-GYP domain-containing protein (c-di-GMP phosphodiesterase class II)|nr:HD domain-containing protein [Zoogloeaceae bacterium]